MLTRVDRAQVCRRPWPPEAIRADPFGYLAEDRAAQRDLAALLEDIADALPGAGGGAAPLVAASRLRRLAAQSQPAEERVYAVIERRAPDGASARQAVDIARREAALVTGLALELADDLDALARAGRASAPEALGFMLRACFEALRRRLDWIEAAILPNARACLDAASAAAIGDALAEAAAATPLRERVGFAVAQGGRRSA